MLDYIHILNDEFLQNNTMTKIVNYMKNALTGQSGDTPSVYVYWTKVLTATLQRSEISAREIFDSFQRFCKTQRGDDLVNLRANDYFQVIAALRRLQHIIVKANELLVAGRDLGELYDMLHELSEIGKYNCHTKEGVFGKMENMPDVAVLLGPVYGELRDYQQEKIANFARRAWYGVPSEEFKTVLHGALTGILLNELVFAVTQAGRSFSATLGRHPSRMRGDELTGVFIKGLGLLENLQEGFRFNGKIMPYILSYREESLKDSFNNGLILGMAYREYKKKDENNGKDN